MLHHFSSGITFPRTAITDKPSCRLCIIQLYITVSKAMMIPQCSVGRAPALRKWKIWEKKMYQFLKVEIV